MFLGNVFEIPQDYTASRPIIKDVKTCIESANTAELWQMSSWYADVSVLLFMLRAGRTVELYLGRVTTS
jgi:hypothetical protein